MGDGTVSAVCSGIGSLGASGPGRDELVDGQVGTGLTAPLAMSDVDVENPVRYTLLKLSSQGSV